MVPMSVEEIAKAVDGRLIGDAGSESRATNTVSDSRQAGPGSVFVAIRGERVDGHDFVAKTAGQGATVAIVDHEVKSDGLPQIVVKDTVDALGELARYNIVRRRELDGDFDITVEIGKDVKWEPKGLAELVAKIEATGGDPREYVEIKYSVSEAKFKAWPQTLRAPFEALRTVTPKAPKFVLRRLDANKEGK